MGYGEGKGIAAMTTLTIHLPDHQAAALARQAAAQGRAVEAYAAMLLEEAVHAPPAAPSPVDAQSLFESAKPLRGLFTDAEIDHLFSRNPSRPVDLA